MEKSVLEPVVSKPAVSKTAPPRFRESSFSDYPQIATLESRYGLQTKTYEEWTHLWTQNPTYRQFSHWPIGWVCENEQNEIVGCVSNIPLAYGLDSRNLVAATSRSLVVDTRYRCYAFSLLSRFFKQPNVDLFLNTTVNAPASKLQEMFRAVRVPAGVWNRSAFWITNYRAFAASLLARKKLPAAKAVSYPLSAGLFVRDTLTGRAIRGPHNGIPVEFCTQFDARFDRFWASVRNSSPRRLLATRSREVLDWHFRHAIEANRAWVLAISQGSELAAYGVFRRQDNPTLGLFRMRLVDFQTAPGRTELLKPILHSALERCRHEGIHMLEAIGFCGEKQRLIDSLAPYYRELTSWRYFYKTNDWHLAARLEDPQTWDATCFDGDASL